MYSIEQQRAAKEARRRKCKRELDQAFRHLKAAMYCNRDHEFLNASCMTDLRTALDKIHNVYFDNFTD